MNSFNCSLILHTFNGYQLFWDGCIDSFRKHWTWDIPIYFGTNTENHEIRDFSPFKPLYSGPGEWSDRLISLLKQVDSEYIFYIQEDHWLTDNPPNLSDIAYLMKKYSLFRLQISPIVRFYSLYGSHPPYFFREKAKSKYLCCHQPSVWRRDFLLSCLQPNETPWENEYKATCRLWQKPEAIHEKIAILPWEWYEHVGVKGKLVKPQLIS